MKFNKLLIILSLLFILIASVGVVGASAGVCDVGVVGASAGVCDVGVGTNNIDNNEEIIVKDISIDEDDSDSNVLNEEPLVAEIKKDMHMDFYGMEYSVEYGKGFPVTVKSTDSNLTGNLSYILDNENYLNTSFNNGVSGTIIKGLNAGYHNVSVFYHDDVNYNDCLINYSFRIIRADMSRMSISVLNQDNSTNLVYGDLIKVIVNFKDGKDSGWYQDGYIDETGTLSFSLDNINWFDETFNDGIGYHIFDKLNVSDYTVYIKYSGDNNYRSGNGSGDFKVNKKSLDITIPKIIYVEEGLELNLPYDITGFITVLDIVDGYSIRINLEDIIDETGKVVIPFTNFTYGNHNIVIGYEGDNNFNPFSVDAIVDVQSNKINTVIYANNLTMFANQAKDFIITLKDINGNLLAGRTLNITFNGESYNFVSDEYGQVKFHLSNLLAKTYNLNVKFLGDLHYNMSSASYKVVVNKVVTTISASNLAIYAFNTKNLVVTLKDSNAKVLGGKKIVITFNGKNYTRTTNSKGQASLAIKSTVVKTYTATIKFAGDNNYKASSKSVKVTIKTAYVTVKDIIKSVKSLKSYSAKYKKLPSTIVVGSITCTVPQLDYLMTVAIKKIYAKKKITTKVKVINVKTAGNYNAKVSKKLYKKSYLSLVNTLYKKGLTGKLPKYIKYGKKIGYNVYTFSLTKILVYYNSKKRLPNYCVFKNY